MRTIRIIPRALVAAIAVVLLSTTSTPAQASTLATEGDFPWTKTAVVRLANCAASDFYNNQNTGHEITGCNEAATDPKWDSSHLVAADYTKIIGIRVPYRGDGSCPSKAGYAYIKCFAEGGGRKGHVMMTVAVATYMSSGIIAKVTWYYR